MYHHKNHPFVFALAGCAATCISPAIGEASPAMSFTGLGLFPGGGSTTALRVSADGNVVVGTAAVSTVTRGFRWTRQSGFEDIGSLPGSTACAASGVSADGSVIVGSCRTDTGHAVRWDVPHGLQDLGDPGHGAQCVSGDGAVIAVNGGGLGPSYIWSDTTGYQSLGLLPGGTATTIRHMSLDGRVIVGGANASLGSARSFRWTRDTGIQDLGPVPGHTSSEAKGTNRDGSVVVGIAGGGTGWEGYRWSAATGMVLLGAAPGDSFSQVFAVSGDGNTIVGGSTLSSTGHAIIWQPTTGMRSLQDLLGTSVPSGWLLNRCISISDDGLTIIGIGMHNSVEESWVATIPAPASTGVAVSVLLLCSRRRRTRSGNVRN